MEILEVHSHHDLTVRDQDRPRPGAHTYKLNCRQFNTLYRDWQRGARPAPVTLGLMTLGFERIWMTEPELVQVSNAIHSQVSPLALE